MGRLPLQGKQQPLHPTHGIFPGLPDRAMLLTNLQVFCNTGQASKSTSHLTCISTRKILGDSYRLQPRACGAGRRWGSWSVWSHRPALRVRRVQWRGVLRSRYTGGSLRGIARKDGVVEGNHTQVPQRGIRSN